jgi:protein involved in polysaccharide export with SLBB domain
MSVGGPREAGPTITITRKTEFGRIPLREARDEEGGKFSVVDVNVEDVMSARTAASGLLIQPFDVISVSPKEQQSQKVIHIIGEVQKPGAVELVLQKSVSVMQVLAAAGGPTRTASLGKAIIMHVNPEGLRTEIATLDLRKIMGGKVKDVDLIAGDILVVPSSNLKTYTDIAARAVVGSSSGLLLARF